MNEFVSRSTRVAIHWFVFICMILYGKVACAESTNILPYLKLESDMPTMELPSTYNAASQVQDLGNNRFRTAPLAFTKWMSLSELNICRSNAFAGQLNDIRRLVDYYRFSREDEVVGACWLAVGIELGGDSIDIHSLETMRARSSSIGRSFELNEIQIQTLIERVITRNDAKAAFRLFLFYRFTKNDEVSSRSWLAISMKYGSIGAEAWKSGDGVSGKVSVP